MKAAMQNLHWSAKWTGIPFKPLGRTLDGLDCWGLVKRVYGRELGIILPGHDGTDHREQRALVAEIIAESASSADWRTLETGEMRAPFDVAVFRVGRHDSHVGVLIDADRMLHVSEGQTSCIERLSSLMWRDRLAFICRHHLQEGRT